MDFLGIYFCIGLGRLTFLLQRADTVAGLLNDAPDGGPSDVGPPEEMGEQDEIRGVHERRVADVGHGDTATVTAL